MQVAEIAGRQRGRITRAQLAGVGIRRGAIAYRVAVGRLIREHEGVYLVGHVPSDPLGPLLSALLACGPPAALSHGAAAAVHGLAPVLTTSIDVTVAPGRRVQRPGLRIHRFALTPPDVVRREGLMLTRPELTVLQIAGISSQEDTERLLQEAFARRLITRPSALATLARHPRARGAAALRTMLDGDVPHVRSPPEGALLGLIRTSGLPVAELNRREGRWTPDLVWPDLGLVVEIDGYGAHSSPWAFERDRRKDRAQRNAGRETLRVTGREIERRPLAVLVDVARAIERRTALRARAA